MGCCTEVTPFVGEVSDECLAYYIFGKTALPTGCVGYRVTHEKETARVAAIDASGAELRAWELPLCLAERPALSTVEVQVNLR